MKRTFIICIFSAMTLMLVSCGVTSTERKAARTAEARELALKIDTSVTNKDFTIVVDRILPMHYPSRSSQDGYTLSVKGNKVTCRLPYFGVSRTPLFGNEDLSIVFKDYETTIMQDFSKHGEYKFFFKANNGTAAIGVNCNSRDSISYQGNVSFEEKK